jgi:diguanylate cyclase
MLKAHLRQNDIAARYGGEEFLILLPETSIDGAKAVAQKIKKTLSAKEWKLKGTGEIMGKITISMGIAMYKLNEPEKDLIKRADDALYLAKDRGRNKIIVEDEI